MAQKSIFDIERDRARRESQRTVAAGTEALKRRQAQLGGGPSGAFIKQEQLLRQGAAEQQGRQFEAIGAAEAAQRERLSEAQKQREFLTQERLGGETFQSEQAALARSQQAEQFGKQFGLQERAFESELGLKQRAFALQEKLGLAGLDMQQAELKLREEVQKGQLSIAEAQQALAEKAQADQLAVEKQKIGLTEQQLGLDKQKLAQQNEQFLAQLQQQGVLQAAQIENMKATAQLANQEFQFNQEQAKMENIINSSTNMITLINNMVNSKRLQFPQIKQMLEAVGMVVDQDGNAVPATDIATKAFAPPPAKPPPQEWTPQAQPASPAYREPGPKIGMISMQKFGRQ